MDINSTPSYAQLKALCKKNSYVFFDEGDYNLNIIGIRSNERDSNAFDDVLCLAFKQNGKPVVLAFTATTDPGKKWLQKPMHHQGTAIISAGQYRGLWTMGKHQGQYMALVQRGAVTVYRDNDGNTTLDMNSSTQQQGLFGINLHRANALVKTTAVNGWSAGCQVLPCPNDFKLLITLCARAKQLYGNSFTYTLFNEAEL